MKRETKQKQKSEQSKKNTNAPKNKMEIILQCKFYLKRFGVTISFRIKALDSGHMVFARVWVRCAGISSCNTIGQVLRRLHRFVEWSNRKRFPLFATDVVRGSDSAISMWLFSVFFLYDTCLRLCAHHSFLSSYFTGSVWLRSCRFYNYFLFYSNETYFIASWVIFFYSLCIHPSYYYYLLFISCVL